MQVAVGPAEGDLQRGVEFREGEVGGHAEEAVNVGAVAVGEADEEEVAVYAARLEPCQSPSARVGVKQGPGDTCCGLLATSAGLAESSRWAGGLAGWAFFLGALDGFFLPELELA